MKRSHALALSAMTLFLATSASVQAQMPRSGQQCQPAVANASMYGNCRLRIVQGQEVCRCAIRPQARRAVNQDVRAETTGSIGAPGASFLDRLFGSGTSAVAAGTSARSVAGSPAIAGSTTGRSAASSGSAMAGAAGNSGSGSAAGRSAGGGLAGAAPGDASAGASVGGNSASGGGPASSRTAAALEARAAEAAADRQLQAAMGMVPDRGMETVRGRDRATTTALVTDRSLPTTPVPT